MSAPAAATIDGDRWTLTPAGRALLANDDLRLDRHIAAGRATVVKHGEHRTVYRVVLATGVVYWKHCRLNGSRAWWRDVFRGPKAKLEFDRALALAERGIPTVEPLAWGQPAGAWPKGSFLITRAVEGAEPLDEHLLGHPPATPFDRRRLTLALAAFISRLHAAGVTHPDLHPGNILIRPEAAGPSFCLIDIHDVELGPPAGPRARIQDLVLLNRWFQMRSTRADRLRFWRAFRPTDWSENWAKEIERETEWSSLRLWRSRDTRCLRGNRHFRCVRGSGVSGHAVRELPAEAVDTFLADPDAPFNRPDVVLLKDSRSATVCEVKVPTADGPRVMVYKRFLVTEWYDPVVNLFRPSAALRSWVNGHALVGRGLPTPRPWLALHRRRFGFAGVGYLLCEKVPDAIHLHEAVAKFDRRAVRRLTEVAARWVRLFHERGVTHRDLKAANLLVGADGDLQFIDLVGVRTGRVSPHLRVRDLARLNASFISSNRVTRTDRLRFLCTYLLWGARGRAGWRDWWVQIDRATRAKVRKNEARDRPLA